MKILFRVTLIGLLAWLLAACERSPVLRLYDGPERTDSDILTVRVPEQLELLTVNDQRVEQGTTLLSPGYQDLQFTPGEYHIVAYYKELWELDVSSHQVYRSDPVTFTVDGNGGEFYRLNYDKPNNAREAEQLADHFSGWSENIATGERRDTTASNMQRPSLLTTLSSGSSAPAPAAATSVAPAGESAPAARTAPVAPAASSTTPATASDGASMGYVDMLKAYWSQANSDERREFLRWISE